MHGTHVFFQGYHPRRPSDPRLAHYSKASEKASDLIQSEGKKFMEATKPFRPNVGRFIYGESSQGQLRIDYDHMNHMWSMCILWFQPYSHHFTSIHSIRINGSSGLLGDNSGVNLLFIGGRGDQATIQGGVEGDREPLAVFVSIYMYTYICIYLYIYIYM